MDGWRLKLDSWSVHLFCDKLSPVVAIKSNFARALVFCQLCRILLCKTCRSDKNDLFRSKEWSRICDWFLKYDQKRAFGVTLLL